MASSWDFMRQWWRSLNRFHELRCIGKTLPGSQQYAFCPLTLMAPDHHHSDMKDQWIERRDALELVMLQLTVDERAFMENARELFDDPDAGEGIWGRFHIDPVFPCAVEFVVETLYSRGEGGAPWILWELSSLLEPVQLKDRGKKFRAARTKILAMADEQTRRKIDENKWTIPVNVGFEFDVEVSLAAALERVAQLKQAMDAVLAPADNAAEEKRRAALRVFPFRVVSVDVGIIGFKISARLNHALAQVTKTRGLPLRDVQYETRHKPQRQMLGALVHSLMNAGLDNEDTEPDGTLSFPHRSDEKAMGSMEYSHFLSALLPSRQFHSVIMMCIFDSFDQSERRLMWLWIVHTLFSSTANRKITTFEFATEKVTEDDVAAMRSYMDAKNPVALLCHPSWRFGSEQDPTMPPRKRVALSDGADMLLSSSGTRRTRRTEAMSLLEGGWFDVIQENNEFVDVVVPAYGQCRVRKDEVTEWQALPDMEPKSALNDHPIKSLKLMVPEDYRDPLGSERSNPHIRALLELVGQPLESLDVEYEMVRSDLFLDDVWAACPNLKVMTIERAQIPSLDYFVDAYETGKCRVESMNLQKCLVSDPSSRMRLFQALEGREPRTKLASTLQEFSFSEEPEDNYEFLTMDELKDIVDKLRSNQVLRFVRLGAMDDEIDALDDMVKPLHGECLRGQRTPLSMRQKCALLGIVKLANDPTHAAAIPAAGQLALLDSGVLSDILAFAAHPVKRSISFTTW